MRKLFYRWLIGTSYTKFHYKISDALKEVEDFDLLTNADSKFDINKILNDDENNEKNYCVVKQMKNEKVSYNMFIGNLHIRVEQSALTQVYSMHIKNKNAIWEFETNENGEIDYSHPKTETYRVYIWYDVPVLNITSSIGELYEHGTWDKYVYQTFNSLISKIYNETDVARFNENYNF